MFASLGQFSYHEPHTVEEATRLLAEVEARSVRILAGGCDLVRDLRQHRSEIEAVINISHLTELDRCALDGDHLVIGALASLRKVERFGQTRTSFPCLHESIASIASVQVKNTGTLVGNLCVATPASDIAPALIALDAEVQIVSRDGQRTTELIDLFRGAKQNSLARGELVTEVRIKRAPSGAGSAFAKLSRTAADCAKINAAASISVEGERCTGARVCLGAVAARPVRAARAEELLTGARLSPDRIAEAAAAAAADIDPISDVRSTASYRRAAMEVLVGRIIHKAFERASTVVS